MLVLKRTFPNFSSLSQRAQDAYARLEPYANWRPLVTIVVLGLLTIKITADVPLGVTPEGFIGRAEAALPPDALDDEASSPSPDVQAPIAARKSRWRVVTPGVVRSRSGASARVAKQHTAKFQCLVDWLDDHKFHIKSMGGIASRPYAGSLHPIGAALDIDQARRNALFRGKRYPAGINQAAASCGLMHGDRSVWRSHPDYGHFQVAGISRGHFARRHRGTATASVAQSGHRVRLARTSGMAASGDALVAR